MSTAVILRGGSRDGFVYTLDDITEHARIESNSWRGFAYVPTTSIEQVTKKEKNKDPETFDATIWLYDERLDDAKNKGNPFDPR